MPRPRSRGPRAHGSSTSRCAASGPRRRPDSTRHPATCSPASTPTRCPRPTGWPRSSGGCRGPTARRSSPAPGVFYGGTAPRRWIARNLYIGGYFTVIGALLGHPPIYGSNYAMRADAWLELRDIVHRDRADLHDDLDLAWWLQPGMTVVHDRALVVGVSARPFDSLPELGRRLRMAFHTLGVEWRAWPPFERRAVRRIERRPVVAGDARRGRRAPTPTARSRCPRDRAPRRARGYGVDAGLVEEREHVAHELVRRRLAGAVARWDTPRSARRSRARTARAARAATGRARRRRRASARATPRVRRARRASAS